MHCRLALWRCRSTCVDRSLNASQDVQQAIELDRLQKKVMKAAGKGRFALFRPSIARHPDEHEGHLDDLQHLLRELKPSSWPFAFQSVPLGESSPSLVQALAADEST